MGTNSQSATMETEENAQTPAACIVSVKGLKENWQKWSSEHQEYQKHNPFSHNTRPSVVVPPRGGDEYGKPLQGSLTEQRGKDAHTHISREVQELCEVIRSIGESGGSDGKVITLVDEVKVEH